MANKERPDERQARGIVEVALGVTLEQTDDKGDADYGPAIRLLQQKCDRQRAPLRCRQLTLDLTKRTREQIT
jgi:hypothetical protein